MWPREEAPHFSSRLPCLQHLTLLTSSSYSSPSEALQAASNASPSPPPTATSPTAHLWAQWRLSNITEWLTEHFLFPSVLLLLLLLPFPSRTSSFQAWPVSLSLVLSFHERSICSRGFSCHVHTDVPHKHTSVGTSKPLSPGAFPRCVEARPIQG